MRLLTVTRGPSTDEGTPGVLQTDRGYRCVTLELPWRYNVANRSCIPVGDYVLSWRPSPKHGFCFYVLDVIGRMDVEIHAANLAGDVAQGYVSELLGCLATGTGFSRFLAGTAPAGLKDQWGVTGSVAALRALEEDLGTADCRLLIR